MTQVTLTWSEMLIATQVGVQRRVQDLRAGRQERFNCRADDRWDREIEGACGELAVAKAFGLYWSGSLGDLQADDVGTLQVRTTPHAVGRLILHKSDPSDRVFVLVTGLAPAFTIAGWIRALDGKHEKWWADPQNTQRWAYFVPQSALRTFEELKHHTTQENQR